MFFLVSVADTRQIMLTLLSHILAQQAYAVNMIQCFYLGHNCTYTCVKHKLSIIIHFGWASFNTVCIGNCDCLFVSAQVTNKSKFDDLTANHILLSMFYDSNRYFVTVWYIWNHLHQLTEIKKVNRMLPWNQCRSLLLHPIFWKSLCHLRWIIL